MQVVACPLCATTDALVGDVAQFIDSYGRPCDHAETVATVEVLHIQFIATEGGDAGSLTPRCSATPIRCNN